MAQVITIVTKEALQAAAERVRTARTFAIAFPSESTQRELEDAMQQFEALRVKMRKA
jgi:hypothetical protein